MPNLGAANWDRCALKCKEILYINETLLKVKQSDTFAPNKVMYFSSNVTSFSKR